MQPEIMSQLIQFGALGLLAAVLWYVMQFLGSMLGTLTDTLKALVGQIAELQKTMLDAVIDAKNESVLMARSLPAPGTNYRSSGLIIPNKDASTPP